MGASPATCRDVVQVQLWESTQGITIFKTTPSGGEATYHAIVWSCTAGPGLSPEESDSRVKEVGELHDSPQEESDIRRHHAVGFRPEQPYLRTLTLSDEDGGTLGPPACEPTGPSTYCAAAAPSPCTTTNLTAGQS